MTIKMKPRMRPTNEEKMAMTVRLKAGATRGLLMMLIVLMATMTTSARNRVMTPQVCSLVATVNGQWQAPNVMRLNSEDRLEVGFDELSHDNHRYIYRIERCEADWTVAEGVFESEWLEGFNGLVMESGERSVNTVVPYTHYRLVLPNDECRLKMSGNYRIMIDDDDEGTTVATVELMVVEPLMTLSLSTSRNTDIDTHTRHQQLTMRADYGGLRVTRPEEQVIAVVTQNQRCDNRCWNPRPTLQSQKGLEWLHARNLIFEGGNEYRKFEALDPTHPTMGIDSVSWDGENYQVFPFVDMPRPYYTYDEDANGNFLLRNSDNWEVETTSEYVAVNYRLRAPRLMEGERIVIDGRWTTGDERLYEMVWDERQQLYTACVMQKQGYYSYQYLLEGADGRRRLLPSEGCFSETENTYQAYIYYKGTGERTWRLVAYGQTKD